jgi:hypothetical protein
MLRTPVMLADFGAIRDRRSFAITLKVANHGVNMLHCHLRHA